jgi:phage anti-repressor protein
MTQQISLKDFLKLYTGISNKFIDEYYLFYEMCENNMFGINSRKVIKYLKIKHARSFHEILRQNYILESDYIIQRLQQKSQKNKQDVFYYLSFDGFEKVCMASRSERGNQVRDYFILLRKFINYYRLHFANKIIDLTKNNKYIYIILVNKNKDIFKIGRTDDIKKRLKNYATGKDKHPDIQFIMIVDDAKQIENCAKLFTKENRFRESSEIYKINFDKLKSVIFGCADLHNNFKDKKVDLDTYVVFDDSKSVDYLDLSGNVIGYEKGHKIIKKYKKNSSKKLSKKSSKNLSKKLSK